MKIRKIIFVLFLLNIFTAGVKANEKGSSPKCNWNSANIQGAEPDMEGGTKILPLKRYCLHPSGEIQRSDYTYSYDNSMLSGRLNSRKKYSEWLYDELSGRKVGTHWYVTEWRLDGNKLRRYRCTGNSEEMGLRGALDCEGSSEMELEGLLGITLKSLNADDHYKIADELERIRKYDLSIISLNKVLKMNPAKKDVLVDLARLKYFTKDFQGSIKASNKYFQKFDKNESYPPLLEIRGMARYEIGKDKKACTDLKKAASLNDIYGKRYVESARGSWCRNMEI